MPLEPWIIEKILEREREERRRKEDGVGIEISDDDLEGPEAPPASDPGHEMPADRKPGHEKPFPDGSPDSPDATEEAEPKRGVDISRITGTDDEEDGGTVRQIDIKKEVPAPVPVLPAKKPKDRKPE
jgi:hypothetical protein